MREQCVTSGDVHVHFLGEPVLEVTRNGANLVNIIAASADDSAIDRVRVWITVYEADARRLYEALGAVLNSEVRADA